MKKRLSLLLNNRHQNQNRYYQILGVRNFNHVPVLLHEAVQAWKGSWPTSISPLYFCDVTCGGGGHSAALLAAEPNAQILCIDRDPDAINTCRERLSTSRVKIELSAFASLRQIMKRADFPPTSGSSSSLPITRTSLHLHGVLADLGLSSHQLDMPERGFSFRLDGPLDMRMERKKTTRAPIDDSNREQRHQSPIAAVADEYEDDSSTTNAVTAADLVNHLPEAELKRLLSDYGEERLAGRVARAIVQRRTSQPFTRTLDLADVVATTLRSAARSGFGPSLGFGHPATRTFMALRIAVNSELRQLQKLLVMIPPLLAPGASFVVISFHSLEDRMVKQSFASHPENEFIASKDVIVASPDEIARNPRARSAKMRILKKLY